MRIYALTKVIPLVCITALMLTCVCQSSCQNDKEPGFGIYLADSGELVLSEEHIEAYDWDSHTIELNEKGIEKWNSYVTIVDIPRLEAKFYKKGFVVKIKREEIYRGEFTSFISSTLPQGVIISDASIFLEEYSDTIKIGYLQPMSTDAEADPRESQVVLEYLESQGLLK